MSGFDFSSIFETSGTEEKDEVQIDIEVQEIEENPVMPTVEKEEDFLDGQELVPEKEAPETPEAAKDNPIDSVIDSMFQEESEGSPEVKEGVDYNSLAQKMISEGVWEQFDTLETEEGDVPLTDIDLDEDMFLSIQRQQVRVQVEQELEGYSDFTKKLISIEKSGGDVRTALESYQQYQHPMDNLDLETVEGQRAAIFLAQSSKLDKEEVLRNIRDYEKAGTLEERALDSKKNVEVAFKAHLEQLEEQGKQRKVKEAELLKQYKKDIAVSLGSAFDLTASYRRKLVATATNHGEEGFEMDVMYRKFRQDPKKASELLLFLADKEEYDKQIVSKREKELTRKEFTKMRVTPKRGSGYRKQTTKVKTNRGGTSLEDLL